MSCQGRIFLFVFSCSALSLTRSGTCKATNTQPAYCQRQKIWIISLDLPAEFSHSGHFKEMPLKIQTFHLAYLYKKVSDYSLTIAILYSSFKSLQFHHYLFVLHRAAAQQPEFHSRTLLWLLRTPANSKKHGGTSMRAIQRAAARNCDKAVKKSSHPHQKRWGTNWMLTLISVWHMLKGSCGSLLFEAFKIRLLKEITPALFSCEGNELVRCKASQC